MLQVSWEAVLDETLLPRLSVGGCEVLAFVPFDDARLQAAIAQCPPTVTEQSYEGVPLADYGSAARGSVLTTLARALEAMRAPEAVIEDAVAGLRVDGRRRGPHQAAYSYLRDGVRVACKGGQLKFDTVRAVRVEGHPI